VLRVENTSAGDVDFVDDPQLLWFEVSLPGQPKPTVCRLPEDLFPRSAAGGTTKALAPREAIVHPLDPRFYCFSPGNQEVLVPSAQVTPHYGWPSKTKVAWKGGRRVEEVLPDTAPFVAAPVQSASEGPAKSIAGDILVLDARYAAWTSATASKDDAANKEDPDAPVLELVRGSDAQTERSATATVRVKNPSGSRLVVFVRREFLTFQVMTPSGSVDCSVEPDLRNPDRHAFTTVSPHGSMTLVSRLVELCPRGTFLTPALYLVHARLDVAADGADFGLDAFTGTLQTEKPIPIRVRHGLQILPNRRVPSGQPGAPGGAPPPPGLLQIQAAAAAVAPAAAPAPAPAPPPPPPPAE
jgi:hypothetical protein